MQIDQYEIPKQLLDRITRAFPEGLVVFDLETTGLAPMVDKIIEIAAIKIDENGELSTFSELINPGIPIPPETTEIHHITDEMVKNSKPIDEILPQFLDFIGNTALLAHSAKYDTSFLTFCIHQLNLDMPKNKVYCSCQLSRAVMQSAANHRLVTLIKHFELDADNSHRALDDSHSCLLVFGKILEVMAKRNLTSQLHDKAYLFSLKDYARDDLYDIPDKLQLIGASMMKDVILEIEYRGGTMTRDWRPIVPFNFLPHPAGLTLQALCLLSNEKKSFIIGRIKSVRVPSKDNLEALNERFKAWNQR